MKDGLSDEFAVAGLVLLTGIALVMGQKDVALVGLGALAGVVRGMFAKDAKK